MRKRQEYALYKGDEFIDLGTIPEIAKRQKVNQQTIRYYQTPQYKNRGLGKDSKKRKVLIKLD